MPMSLSRAAIAVSVLLAPLALSPSAHGQDLPASGTFTMTTAPGILPACDSADITVVGLAPGSVTTSRFSSQATITLPIVAKNGTANATAGGFRIVNTATGDSVRCLIPTIDTRARVIDCLTSAGYNIAIFTIDDIATRQKFVTAASRTTIFEGMEIRLTASGAAVLNRELEASAFSTSVTVATGDLIVRR